jgi:transcriptional regulator with XRE-family HTH domain
MTDTLNGEAIRLLRGARGCSLREFASRVEISPGYLSKIETDGITANAQKPNVSPRVINRIAYALGVPVKALTDHQAFAEELAKAWDRPEDEVVQAYWDARVPMPARAVA